MHRRAFFSLPAAAALSLSPARPMRMPPWGDTTRLGRPFSKDPCVIRLGGRYLIYYSLPPFGDGRANDGWGIGIAESQNLLDWARIGEIPPAGDHERKGICAPFAMTLRPCTSSANLWQRPKGRDLPCDFRGWSRVHRFPQPCLPASGDWNSGRAIDVEVARYRGKWFPMPPRDPRSRVQMITGAVSTGGFARGGRRSTGPLPRTSLGKTIEAPSVLEHEPTVYVLAGA